LVSPEGTSGTIEGETVIRFLQQQQTLDPVFSLCKEFMADSQFPRA
jgi:hypothetical protein